MIIIFISNIFLVFYLNLDQELSKLANYDSTLLFVFLFIKGILDFMNAPNPKEIRTDTAMMATKFIGELLSAIGTQLF